MPENVRWNTRTVAPVHPTCQRGIRRNAGAARTAVVAPLAAGAWSGPCRCRGSRHPGSAARDVDPGARPSDNASSAPGGRGSAGESAGRQPPCPSVGWRQPPVDPARPGSRSVQPSPARAQLAQHTRRLGLTAAGSGVALRPRRGTSPRRGGSSVGASPRSARASPQCLRQRHKRSRSAGESACRGDHAPAADRISGTASANCAGPHPVRRALSGSSSQPCHQAKVSTAVLSKRRTEGQLGEATSRNLGRSMCATPQASISRPSRSVPLPEHSLEHATGGKGGTRAMLRQPGCSRCADGVQFFCTSRSAR